MDQGEAVMLQRMWAKRAAAFGETIFSEMNALAAAHGAVNLGQGAPDFGPPAFVLAAAQRAVGDGSGHQYTHGAGDPLLREALAEQLAPQLGRQLDAAREVTVTNGATEALFVTILALTEPGDEVILFEPFYDCYPADVNLAGASARYVPLRPQADGSWAFDPEELAAAFSPRTKLILVNTPHNPTGKVFDRAELEQIAALCQRYDALALCDEVYERLVFRGEHLSMASLDGMWERCLTISSAGKTFSVTGWKIGWVVAPPELSLAVRRIHQWVPFSVATPLQRAVAAALREAPGCGYYGEFVHSYAGKRARLIAALEQTPFRPYAPDGTYFVVADASAAGYGDDIQLCRALTRDFGVTAIPSSVFYSEAHRALGQHLVRFAFCKGDALLDEAARRLLAFRAAGAQQPATP